MLTKYSDELFIHRSFWGFIYFIIQGCVKLFSIPEVVLVVCDYVDKYVCDVAEVDYSASKATIEDDCCLEPKFYIRFKFQN